MTVVAPSRPRSATQATGSTHDFRPDIEGMRAVAVGLVLLYHAGLPFVPGGFIGVDVFFVISGFLITRMLVRELEQTGRVSLVRFYARRVRRLLPAATLVLLTTSILTWLFVSTIDWRTFGIDIAAAATYVVNWRLADRSVDYLAEDVGASPVQHFWSLAVEEQFYIVWPLLILLVAWWVRRSGWPVRRAMAGGLALVAVPSLIWSIHLTATSPSIAFFVSTTRMWELAAGAIVAIAARRFARTPVAVAVVGAWAGLALVAIAGLLFDTTTPWPGSAALVPVIGTAAVIAFGPAASGQGPVALLRHPPFQWVGKLSYSLYLWHWPLLIAATAYWGELSAARGAAVIAFSFIPAWLAFTIIEDPARRLSLFARMPKIALAVGAALTAAGVAAGTALTAAVANSDGSQPETAQGAAVLEGNADASPPELMADQVDWMTPQPVDAPNDLPAAYADDCQVGPDSATPKLCEYGSSQDQAQSDVAQSGEEPVTVAIVGDSKVLQWLSALTEIAERRDWRLHTYTKSDCPFADAVITQNGSPYDTCTKWNQAVLDQLLAAEADLVVTSQRRAAALNVADDPDGGASREAMADGLARRWAELEDAGTDVIVLADNPAPDRNVYECVAENPDNLTTCSFDRAEGVERSAAPTQRSAANRTTSVALVDMSDDICLEKLCPPVIGNVLVYRQGTHLTDTYIRSLAPRLEEALLDVWNWDERR